MTTIGEYQKARSFIFMRYLTGIPTILEPYRMSLAKVVNSRTIARDLAILTETHLYNIEIKVCGGIGRVAKIDVEDFAPLYEVLEVWKSLGSKTKPLQLADNSILGLGLSNATPEFPALPNVVNELNAIVHTIKPSSQGIFQGTKQLKGDFTLIAFKDILDYRILHLALT
jgi:hypothetical protein